MEQEHKFSQPLFLQFENTQIPEFKEVRSKDWVYFGEDNLWPDYVIELYQRSAKHNAIINGKVNYIIGGGFKEATNKWIEKVNPYENLKELTAKICYDLEIFNAYALEIIYGMNGKIVEMYHVDFSRIRTNKDESKYYYSENWNIKEPAQHIEKTNYKEYDPFDFNAKKKSKGKQLFVYTIKTPRKTGEPNVYPIPEYMGALSAIETDVEISNFHLTNIKTGFSAGTMVNLLNGMPSPEEARILERKFKEKFTGTDKAGSLILNFAIDKEHAAEVLHMQPSDMDKQYLQMSDRVNQEIFTGHKVTSPILFGVMTPGSLGQRNEMLDAYELFSATYISIRQKLIEDTFNKLALLNRMPNDIEIVATKPLTVALTEQSVLDNLDSQEKRDLVSAYLGQDLKKTFTPTEALLGYINSVNPRVAEKVLASMTTNEVRELVGLGKTTEIPQNLTGIPAAGTPAVAAQMKSQKQEMVLTSFSKYGFSQSEFERVKTRKVKFTSTIDLQVQDEVAKELFKDDDDDYLNAPDNPLLPSGRKPTPPPSSDLPKISLQVVYSYEWRSEIPVTERDTPAHPSRPFCHKLMDLNRYYKRSDLENISNEIGYNVFQHTGGFWNDEGDIQDHCRHEWQQHIVTKKGV